MNRLLLLLVISAFALGANGKNYPTMFAHRGCWSKNSAGEFIIPENSVAGVTMAARMGYKGIECDVHYTKDGKMVILHDKTINRTMRRASDYSKIEEPIKLSDLTFEQIRTEYILESENPNLRTPIPTLEEILAECKRVGMVPMLHSNIPDSYKVAQSMFGNDWIAFTADFEPLKELRSYSDCTILYSINSGTAEQTIEALKQIGGSCGVSSMRDHLYTAEFCKALTDAGYEVQASIFKSPKEVIAQRNGITYQLSDFSIMPTHKPLAVWRSKAECTKSYSTSLECGAILTEIEYCGTIEVTINGTRTYTLTRETMGRDVIGNRLFNTTPQISITAKEGTIKRTVTKVYSY